MKKIIVIVLSLVLVITGCTINEEVRNTIQETEYSTEDTRVKNTLEKIEYDTETMDGMNYLFKWNTNGCYLGLHGSEEEGDHFIRLNSDGSLYLDIESGGEVYRELGVQIFIDYEQIPIQIDNNIVDVYSIPTDHNISVNKKIWLGTEIEENSVHKVTIVLANYTDKNIGFEENMDRSLSGDLTMFDAILINGNETDIEKLHRTDYEYETPVKIYKEEFDGLFITQDTTGKRKVIDRNIYAKAGDTLELQYHVGSTTQTKDIILIMTLDMEQYDINNQKYIICSNEPSKVHWGKMELCVPKQKGVYEIRAFAVPNPYGTIDNKIQVPLGCFRFTLNVR